MSDEYHDFKTCLYKTSKNYYKTAFNIFFGCIFCIGMVCLVMLFVYFLEKFISDILVLLMISSIIVCDVLFIGLFALDYAQHRPGSFIVNFIKAYVYFHYKMVALVIFWGLDIICLTGIPITSFILSIIVAHEAFNNILITGIVALCVPFIVIPLNTACMKCFKVSRWTQDMYDRVELRTWLR